MYLYRLSLTADMLSIMFPSPAPFHVTTLGRLVNISIHWTSDSGPPVTS